MYILGENYIMSNHLLYCKCCANKYNQRLLFEYPKLLLLYKYW